MQVPLLGRGVRGVAPGSARCSVRPRSECVEDRLEACDRGAGAANHQAVAAFDAPDAAAGADIEVVDTAGLQVTRAPNIVDVVRIPAVDHNITRLQVSR